MFWFLLRVTGKKRRRLAMRPDQKATAITRNQAGVAFAATFICVGEKPPVGGLFAENKYGDTNFWNERQPA